MALAWLARYPFRGGLSAALGGLLGVTLPFRAVAAPTDGTGQSGPGLVMLVLTVGPGLSLIALVTAAVRVPAHG